MQGDGSGQGCGGVERTQETDKDRVRFEEGLVGGAGRVDDRDQIRLSEDGGAVAGDGGTGSSIGFVRCTGRFSCAGFNDNGDAPGHERFQTLGKQSDTGLAGSGFFKNA